MAHLRTRHAGAGANGEPARAETFTTRGDGTHRTNADHLPPPASSYPVTERSQHEQ